MGPVHPYHNDRRIPILSPDRQFLDLPKLLQRQEASHYGGNVQRHRANVSPDTYLYSLPYYLLIADLCTLQWKSHWQPDIPKVGWAILQDWKHCLHFHSFLEPGNIHCTAPVACTFEQAETEGLG